MFDSLRLLTNSRLFRKRRYINRLQRLLKFLSLSLFLSVFLHMCAWACRPAAVMFVSASAAPYTADCTAGDGPQLWTVGRRRRHPDSPLVFGGRATAAGTAGGFIALLVCFLLIYLWHTHPITPLTLTHTPSRRFARFPAKGKRHFPPLVQRVLIGPEREKLVKERGFYDFLSWTFCCCLWLWGQSFSYMPITAVIYLRAPPQTSSTLCFPA